MNKKALTVERFGDIALINFDLPNMKLNVLNEDSMSGFLPLIAELEADDSIKACVIISKKENNFVAGADLSQIADCESEKEAETLCLKMQDILDEISDSKKIYVAAINGACIGGGLELALACDFRIATLDEKTQFSFPEVHLGFLPAAGGCQRLPRSIGLKKALDMLLTGKKIDAHRAYKMGLVDYIVNSREELCASSIKYAHSLIKKRVERKEKRLSLWGLPLLWFLKQQIKKKTFGHYPAPFAIIEAVKTGILFGVREGLLFEAKEFGRLSQTSVSKNLVHLFFAKKGREKNPFGKLLSPINTIGIVGAGLMGSGISYTSLLHRFIVYLSDKNNKALSHAKSTITDNLTQMIKKGRLSKLDQNRLLSNLHVHNNLDYIERVDAVIEAVVEDVSVKKDLLKKLEPILKEECIFATNTSSIPIAEIAEESTIKDRIVGMHYFSPVPKVPLLEIVKSKDTSVETLKKALDIGLKQGKTIIVVNDSPGFYTTRIIAALFDEVSILLTEGYHPKKIDHALLRVGFPMGPVALMDEVGLDVGYHVSKILLSHLGHRLIAADLSLVDAMVKKNFLGQKTKIGFYRYHQKRTTLNLELLRLLRPFRKRNPAPSISINERMLLRMVNEAAFCLSENVIESPEDGNVGAVFGVGFPPYLGGPFRYIDEMGKEHVKKRIEFLEDAFGERFLKAPYFDH